MPEGTLVLTSTLDCSLTLAGENGNVVVSDDPALELRLMDFLRGPDGVGSDGYLVRQAVAGADLDGHMAVYVADGVAMYASADDPASARACLGITVEAVASGGAAIIATTGRITEASWEWEPGLVYLGLDGELTQTMPDNGSLVVVAIATSPIELELRPRPVREGLIELPFAWGDASPRTLAPVPAGKLVHSVEIHIATAFDGTGAVLQLGDAGDTDRLMTAGQSAPTEAGTYTASPLHRYGSETPLLFTITPGAGATAGAGLLRIFIEQ